MIPIEGSAGFVPTPNANTDPYAFYMAYYRSKDKDRTSPEKLRKLVGDLNRLRRLRDVHAALMGYLTNNRTLAEAWMYEALALSIQMNGGSAGDVKTSLYYAADLAQRSHNPNQLVSAADKLFQWGYYERVGPMLDEAIKAIPHRAEPLAMSVNLAQKTKDPIRMADALERLLSIGWPGLDDYFRIEAGNEVDSLVKVLKARNRAKEADELQGKLTASLARDLFVRLTWDGYADFDLLVDEPLGATAKFDTPRTVFGGSLIKNGYGKHPEEVYVCPRAFDGKYTIRVTTIWKDPARPVTRLTLETITHEGAPSEKKEIHNLSPDKPNEPVTVTVTGGRRKTVLPYVDPVRAIFAAAPPPPRSRHTSTSNKPAAPKASSVAQGNSSTRGADGSASQSKP